MLNLLLWAKSKKGTKKPKLVARPGVEGDDDLITGKSRDMADIRERLKRRNGR